MIQNTNLLDEAYKKILASKELQMKFMEAAKENKLEAFLKEQNIEATLEEVKAYLTKKFTDENSELSKEELDMAAGGKSDEAGQLTFSLATFGIGCVVSAFMDTENSYNCTFKLHE